MSTPRTKIEIGWISLLFSGGSVLVFLLWALLTAPAGAQRMRDGPRENLTATSASLSCLSLVGKENCREWQSAHHGKTRIEAHIDLCLDHSLPLKVGTVCLPLCRKDFPQLAQSLVRAVEQLPPADVRDAAGNDNLH